MCGICGIYTTEPGATVGEPVILAMRDSMKTRGPDDAGILVHQEERLAVGLGHRRLSIIDLSLQGRQPMTVSDGTLSIVFNGEIFNFAELREPLLRAGRYEFRSKTDTEVILHGVREWGLDGCLARLRGMYAFALFDRHDGSLTLVRDPLGVKPLYYTTAPAGTVAFASEIKALLTLPWLERRIDEAALFHYLTFANAPAPLTFFQGVAKLEAGTYLRIGREGKIERVRYWDPTRFTAKGPRLDDHEYVGEVRRLVRQAVARRMVSDVPFGAFLSGGLDSSLLVALMAERLDRPVETFSIGIRGDPSNELEFARRVSRHVGTHHRETLIDDADFLSVLPRLAYVQDEPLADPVCVPLYWLSKLARESGTTVIQVGEGSDEIFAGYRTYQLFSAWERNGYRQYLNLPASLRALFYEAAKGLVSPERQDALRRASDGDPLFLGNAIAFWDAEKAALLRRPLSEGASSRYVADLVRDLPDADPLLRMTNLELKNRLPELLLMRVDKMSMAHSIETRVPFLDEDLVAFALSIPSDLKVRNGETKYVLKQAATGILPREIIHRKKWGFCGSATNMLSDGLTLFAHQKIMASPLVAERFDRAVIERLFRTHRQQKRFTSFKIWNLLNLALWHECWFEGRSRTVAA